MSLRTDPADGGFTPTASTGSLAIAQRSLRDPDVRHPL